MPGPTDHDATAEDRGAERPPSRGWLPAVAVAAAVLLASVVPVPGGAPADPGAVSLTDPFHLLGYAALAAVLVGPIAATHRERIGFRSEPSPSRATMAALVAVFAALAATAFGLGIELVQARIPWRSFAVADAVVNATGALVGASLAVVWRTRTGDRDGDENRNRS